MGWWRAGEDGSSLHTDETGLIWGDGPADILDEAIENIINEFQGEWRRPPTKAELQAGLLFALGAYEQKFGSDDAETACCKFCGITITNREGAWVDDTGGDVCSGDDNLNNENESHVPSWPAYTIKPNAVPHTCWDTPEWDGLMQDDCKGCQEANQHRCHYCGYGHGFTTHNDLAHCENGDRYVPEHPENEWHNSPHIYEEA